MWVGPGHPLIWCRKSGFADLVIRLNMHFQVECPEFESIDLLGQGHGLMDSWMCGEALPEPTRRVGGQPLAEEPCLDWLPKPTFDKRERGRQILGCQILGLPQLPPLPHYAPMAKLN